MLAQPTHTRSSGFRLQRRHDSVLTGMCESQKVQKYNNVNSNRHQLNTIPCYATVLCPCQCHLYAVSPDSERHASLLCREPMKFIQSVSNYSCTHKFFICHSSGILRSCSSCVLVLSNWSISRSTSRCSICCLRVPSTTSSSTKFLAF